MKTREKRRFILVECEDYADNITAERSPARYRRYIRFERRGFTGEVWAGEFTYCTLGEEIGVEAMLTGENLPDYQSLAAYLLYCATGVAVDSGRIGDFDVSDDGFFHETENVRYHMFYQPDVDWLLGIEGALNYDRAKRISEAARDAGKEAVVFAPLKFVSQEDITSFGITFCQLPYELTASRAQALEM